MRTGPQAAARATTKDSDRVGIRVLLSGYIIVLLSELRPAQPFPAISGERMDVRLSVKAENLVAVFAQVFLELKAYCAEYVLLRRFFGKNDHYGQI